MSSLSIILVDGEVSACLPVDDRGLMYGDGVFRTLRVADSAPRWWSEQITKLTEDCARIGLPAPSLATWNADLERIAPSLTSGVLKLVVTRGVGPRGYFPPEHPQIRRVMRYESVPVQVSASLPDGLVLRVCTLRLGWQPRLAGIKHLNRLENVLARAEWNTPDIHEGLLLDQAGRVISGVMSNLFIWQRGRLLTPRLDQCGVAGVARDRLMRVANAQGMPVEETILSLQDVYDAEEVMLTNSVWGLRRVACLESKSWPNAVVSARLSALLEPELSDA